MRHEFGGHQKRRLSGRDLEAAIVVGIEFWLTEFPGCGTTCSEAWQGVVDGKRSEADRRAYGT